VTSSAYAALLERKRSRAEHAGPPCEPEDVSDQLHDWQRELTAWSVRRGRSAQWWGTGCGKTRLELEFSRLSGPRSLIVAPLAVCYQTVEEAAKIGLEARYVRSDEDAAGPGIWITNYEMCDRFDARWFDSVTLDESSILANALGRRRTQLIRQFGVTPRRLSATATPLPNDPQELTSQAEFLGVMSRAEMLAAYFVHDDEGWRLKGHAREPMFRWLAQWACALRSPADLGYPDDGYRLPPLHIRTHLVRTSSTADELGGIVGRAAVRAATVEARCAWAASLVQHEPHERWLLWAGRNDEARLLAGALPGAVNVEGSWKPEPKAEALLAFAKGEIPVLVTKPSIAGFGMNFQRCARTAFVGLSDSWQQYYQAIRRIWRYGQPRSTYAHIVLSEAEAAIAENVNRKEEQADWFVGELVATMNAERKAAA
jgi:hypothetical protein